MRTLSPVLFLCSILTSVLCAQSATDPGTTPARDLAGRSSLLFSINGLNLGGGIGGTYWRNNAAGFRTILSLNSSTVSTDNLNGADPASELVEVHTFSASLQMALLLSFRRSNTVTPYTGLGIDYGYSDMSEDRTTLMQVTKNSSTRSSYFGVQAILGAEVWLSDAVSLSGEHSLGVRSDHSHIPNAVSRFRFSDGTSQLSLSLYFP